MAADVDLASEGAEEVTGEVDLAGGSAEEVATGVDLAAVGMEEVAAGVDLVVVGLEVVAGEGEDEVFSEGGVEERRAEEVDGRRRGRRRRRACSARLRGVGANGEGEGAWVWRCRGGLYSRQASDRCWVGLGRWGGNVRPAGLSGPLGLVPAHGPHHAS
jgi:hypothetical protein